VTVRPAAGRSQAPDDLAWRDVPFIQITAPLEVREGAEGRPLLVTGSGHHYSVSRASLTVVDLLREGCSGQELYRRVPGAAAASAAPERDPLGQFLVVLQDGGLLNVPPREDRARRSARLQRWAGLDLFRRFPLSGSATRRVEAWGAAVARLPRGLVVALLLGLPLAAAAWGVPSISAPTGLPPAGGVAVIIVVLILQLAVHELLHALTMGFLRLPVRDMGVGLVFSVVPAGYVDRSSTYGLRSRGGRAMVSLSGPLWDLLCLGLVAGTATLVEQPEIRTVMTWLSYFQVYSLVINLNPLFRTDGYYVVESLLGSVNMRTRAFLHVVLTLGRRELPAHLRATSARTRAGYWAYAVVCACYAAFIVLTLVVSAVAVVRVVTS